MLFFLTLPSFGRKAESLILRMLFHVSTRVVTDLSAVIKFDGFDMEISKQDIGVVFVPVRDAGIIDDT
jgi:hypothetical protein